MCELPECLWSLCSAAVLNTNGNCPPPWPEKHLLFLWHNLPCKGKVCCVRILLCKLCSSPFLIWLCALQSLLIYNKIQLWHIWWACSAELNLGEKLNQLSVKIKRCGHFLTENCYSIPDRNVMASKWSLWSVGSLLGAWRLSPSHWVLCEIHTSALCVQNSCSQLPLPHTGFLRNRSVFWAFSWPWLP